MNLLRLFAMLVGCFTLVAMIAAAVADDKSVDKDKIVGTWQLSKSDGKRPPQKVVIQLTKDGKLKATTTSQGLTKGNKKVTRTGTMEGTYKVDGDKLIVVLKDGEKENKRIVTIKTLTDTRLVTIDDMGQEEEFEKK